MPDEVTETVPIRYVKCIACEKKIRKINALKGTDGELYCEECWSDKFFTCDSCDGIGDVDDSYEVEGEHWCSGCYEDHGFQCCACDGRFHTDTMRNSDDGDCYCEDCYCERFTYCNGCDCELEREGDECWLGSDDYSYCESCYSLRFAECSICDEIFEQEDILVNEDGEYFCEECANEEGITGLRRLRVPPPPIPQVRPVVVPSTIREYSYRPEPQFKKMKWENTLFMGFELEVEHVSNIQDKSNELNSFLKTEGILDTFYLKRDGSLQNGFEIVSHPFTLKWAHNELKMKKILEYLEQAGYSSYKNGRCGFHIHLSSDFFEDIDRTKLRLFFAKNSDILHKFSARKDQGNNFCLYEPYDIKKIINGNHLDGRYWALNLNTSKNTIELRLFRGTLSYERILAYLQFADAISWFVKMIGVTSIVYGDGKYKDNSWIMFVDWCHEQKKYGQMLKLLEKENLICV